jgi:integrase
MSRRSGQNGWIAFRKGIYYARFWIDMPGRSTRLCKRVPICPASGPGSLNASERSRRLKQILVEFGANDEVTARATQAANLGITFQQQSEHWLRDVQHRKRKPVKPRTLDAWRSHLRYINPKIGAMPLSEVNNRSMKEFITVMADEKKLAGEPRFSPKSIDTYLAVIKSVVASVKDDRGGEVYEVKWDSTYMDVPLVEEQNTPSFTATEVEAIIAKAEDQDSVLYALLAGSGLRIGEAFALRVEDVRGTVLHVKASAWDGTVSSPKTKSGVREVDIHSSLANLLEEHIGTRTTGFVFPSERGTPMRTSNLLRRSLHPILTKMGIPARGFHSFRRFRAEHLENSLPGSDVLRKLWLGHSLSDVSEKYVKNLKHNTLVRTMSAQKAGLGFESRPIAPTSTDAKSLERWCARRDSNSRPSGS